MEECRDVAQDRLRLRARVQGRRRVRTCIVEEHERRIMSNCTARNQVGTRGGALQWGYAGGCEAMWAGRVEPHATSVRMGWC